MKFLLLLAAVLLPGLAAGQANRAVVPISQAVLPDNDIRYSIPVSIGGAAPIAALLDTGSTGLRLLPGAIRAGAAVTDTGLASVYAYGSGERLSGDIGTASLAIGGNATDTAVPIELVHDVGCMDFARSCPAANLTEQDYGIGGDGIAGQGFQAIIGVSLEAATGAGYTVNPLAHIGDKRWIIELPEPGDAKQGSLIFNPDQDDLSGFQMFVLRPEPNAGVAGTDPGWLDTLAGCLNNLSQDETICGPTMLDTGSPGIIAYRPGGINGPLWSADDATSLAFSQAGSIAAASVPFAADRFPGSGMIQAPDNGVAAELVAGVLPFYAYDVLYDATAGMIGLRPRADAPNMASPPGEETAPDIEVIQMNAPAAPHAGTPSIGIPAPPALPQVIYPSQ